MSVGIRLSTRYINQKDFQLRQDLSHPLSRGLVARYLLDGVTPLQAVNAARNTYIGTSITKTYSRTRTGMAADLDGVNDFIDTADINELDGATEMTISGYATINSIATDKAICAKWDYATQGSFVIQTGNAGASTLLIAIATSLTDPGSGYQGKTGGVLSSGVEAHFTLVYNGAGSTNPDKVKVYINGKNVSLIHSGSAPTALTSATSTFKIGKFGGTLTRYWPGKIRDIRVYTRALSAGEVWNIYNDPWQDIIRMPRLYAMPSAAVGSPWYYYAQQS